MSIYESRLWDVRNRMSQVSDEEARKAMEGIVEILEQMLKELNEVKARVSPRSY